MPDQRASADFRGSSDSDTVFTTGSRPVIHPSKSAACTAIVLGLPTRCAYRPFDVKAADAPRQEIQMDQRRDATVGGASDTSNMRSKASGAFNRAPDIAPGHAHDCVGREGWSDGDNLFDNSNCTCGGRDVLVTDSLRVWANAVDKGNGSPTPDLLRRASYEIDRLRTLVENAPHDAWCTVGRLNGDQCICWKSDAR